MWYFLKIYQTNKGEGWNRRMVGDLEDLALFIRNAYSRASLRPTGWGSGTCTLTPSQVIRLHAKV